MGKYSSRCFSNMENEVKQVAYGNMTQEEELEAGVSTEVCLS